MMQADMERDTAPAPTSPLPRPFWDTKPSAPIQSLPRVIHSVGDDQEIRSLLDLLTSRRRDTQVQRFASGEAFRDQLPTLENGVVLVDFDMPGTNGLDLLTEIRCFATCFPVIARSDRRSIALAVEAMKLGALDFLEKPHDLKSLFAAIEDGFGVIESDHTRDRAGAEIPLFHHTRTRG